MRRGAHYLLEKADVSAGRAGETRLLDFQPQLISLPSLSFWFG